MQQWDREKCPVRLRAVSDRSGATPGTSQIPRQSIARGGVRSTDGAARTAGLVAARCCTVR
jgi:hypothetical protein